MMETKKPKLRFSTHTESWGGFKLSEICDEFIGGGTPSTKSEELWQGSIPWISSSDIFEDKIHDFLVTRFISETAIETSAAKKIPAGSVLVVSRVGVGKVAITKREIATSQDFTNLVINKKFSPNFTAYYFKAKNKRLISIAQGTSIKGFTTGDLKSFKINFPSLPEQQKIASFLSSVDERIELLERKKEKLEAYKKGVMQQIFSQQIRFKQDDGSEFPDWEEKRFSDLYDFKSTNSFSRELLNHENGSYLNIHYGDIHTKFNTLLDASAPNLPFVNDDVEIRKQMRENTVSLGDLIIADASEDYKDIGKAVEISNIGETPVLAGLHTIHAALKNSALEIGFGGYMLKSEGIRKQIMRIAQGTKVLSISATRVGELAFSVPCKEEQRKIVAFLRSIDKSIIQNDSQIRGLRTWKKGLLQQMFV